MGLIDGVGLRTQALERTRFEVRRANELLQAELKKNAGRVLTPRKVGTTLQGLVMADAVGVAQARLNVGRIRGLTGQLSKREAKRRYAQALASVGPRLQSAVYSRQLPAIAVQPGPGRYLPGSIVLPMGTDAIQGRMLTRLAMHWMDGIKSNGPAALLMRDEWKLPGSLGSTPEWSLIPGRWGDVSTGRVYTNDPGRSDVSAIVHGAMVPALATKLATLWQANPQHVGFLLAYLRGAFL